MSLTQRSGSYEEEIIALLKDHDLVEHLDCEREECGHFSHEVLAIDLIVALIQQEVRKARKEFGEWIIWTLPLGAPDVDGELARELKGVVEAKLKADTEGKT